MVRVILGRSSLPPAAACSIAMFVLGEQQHRGSASETENNNWRLLYKVSQNRRRWSETLICCRRHTAYPRREGEASGGRNYFVWRKTTRCGNVNKRSVVRRRSIVRRLGGGSGGREPGRRWDCVLDAYTNAQTHTHTYTARPTVRTCDCVGLRRRLQPAQGQLE